MSCCLFALLNGIAAFGQGGRHTVTGTVLDKQNEPLPGVSVLIKGTRTGTSTDLDGKYSISVGGPRDVLVFSFIGFDTQETVVGTQQTINIVLQETSTALDEVVFVAYGQQKKESVVAALSSINATGLKQTPASNLGIALAGRLPGLTVLQRSGVPGGENMDFFIRGRSTINGQQPLTLVDGVERDFTALDPREVETITILKDASATAVYGVRGANGVIMITTRRGMSGKPVIDVTAEQSWQSATRLPHMTSAYDYALLRNQVEIQNGRPAIYDETALEHYKSGENSPLYASRDFVNEFMREFSPMQRVNVNVSGGTDKMKYFTTVGYLHQNGIFRTEKFNEYDYDPSSKANRINFRSNFDIDISDNLRMFLNVSGFMQKKNDPVMVPFNGDYLNDISGYSVLLSNLLTIPNNSYYRDTTPDGEVMTSYLITTSHIPYGMLNRTGFRYFSKMEVTYESSISYGVEHIREE